MRGAALESVSSAIERAGFVARGALRLDDHERVGDLTGVHTIVLAGFAGRDGWGAFKASAEAGDGLDHPLDRWSGRVIATLARELDANAFFPFGGPPFWPFQQWARRAEAVHPSPIGLLIHPRYGLWHSYRGALGFREALDFPEPAAAPSPCEFLRGTLVPENMSRRRVFSRRLRCRRLRRPPEKPGRSRLHSFGVQGAARLPGRRRTRLWRGAGGFHHAGILARAGQLRTGRMDRFPPVTPLRNANRRRTSPPQERNVSSGRRA